MPSEWAMSEAIESPGFKEAANRSATSDAEYEGFMRNFAEALDAARAQGKREGLEEAAHVALSTAARINEKCERMAKGADLVAADIRARIEEPAAQEPKA